MFQNVSTGLESIWISNAQLKCVLHVNVIAHRNHDRHQQTLASEDSWQHLGADIFPFDRSQYIIVTKDYSKMPVINRIPAYQCNAAKTISIVKELFAGYGIPECLCNDSGPKFTNMLFAKFATEWKFDHNTSSLRNPRSNVQAEVGMKIIKGFLSSAKCSGQDP